MMGLGEFAQSGRIFYHTGRKNHPCPNGGNAVTRLSLQAVKRIGEEAFRRESSEKLIPRHQVLMTQHRGCCYMMAPQADEWTPLLGFAPDQKTYEEVGFIAADPDEGRSVVLVRFLVGRDQDKPYIYADWYPQKCDLRKRPDYHDIREIRSTQPTLKDGGHNG
jgi:uncharacterized protein YciU (UPF0263 family)